MASSLSFVEYLCDQVDGLSFKRMFGEFGLYYQAKMVLLVCDDTLFIKPSDKIAGLLKSKNLGAPYKGSKEYYIIEETDDREYLKELVLAKWEEIPIKVKKIKKPMVDKTI